MISTWLFVIGACLLAWGGWGFVRRKRAAAWPTVEGDLLAAEIEERTVADSPGTPFWQVNVHYRYKIDGRWYESRRLTFEAEATFAARKQQEAHALLAELVPGGKVLVRVNPANPRDAFLRPSSEASWLYFSMGLGLFLAAYMFKGVG